MSERDRRLARVSDLKDSLDSQKKRVGVFAKIGAGLGLGVGTAGLSIGAVADFPLLLTVISSLDFVEGAAILFLATKSKSSSKH